MGLANKNLGFICRWDVRGFVCISDRVCQVSCSFKVCVYRVSMWKIKQICCFQVILNIPLYMHIYLWNKQGDDCHTFKFFSNYWNHSFAFPCHFRFFSLLFQCRFLCEICQKFMMMQNFHSFIASLRVDSKTPNNESVNWCNLPWIWLTFQGLKRQAQIEGSKPAWILYINTFSILQIVWCFTSMCAT